MPHEKPIDASLWSGGQDISGPITLGFETALVLLNIFPICVICFMKQGHSRIAADELILALSITDILSVLVPAPLGWISYFTHQWYGGEHTCQLYQVCVTWFQLTSMCLITFMTFDRWMSLKDALVYKTLTITNNCRVRLSVFLIYAFTFTVSCLPILGLAPRGLSESGKLCQSWFLAKPKATLQYAFHFVFLTVGLANLLTTVLVNLLVISTLWRFQKKFGSKQAERMSSVALQIDKRSVVEVTVMMLIVTLTFYLAWLPSLVLLAVLQFGVSITDEIVMYALLSTTLTGLLNPVIYAIFSTTYRKGYVRMLSRTSKFFFGCPLTQHDVLTDLSRKSHIIRNVSSGSSSLTGLLPPQSRDTSDNDLSSQLQPSDNTSASSHLLSCSCFSRCNSHTRQNTSKQIAQRESSYSQCGMIHSFDPHDGAYMDELLARDELEISREIYGSRLSLISEESDTATEIHAVDNDETHLTRATGTTNATVPILLQESKI